MSCLETPNAGHFYVGLKGLRLELWRATTPSSQAEDEQTAEVLSKDLRQKRVEYRVYAAVHVGEAAGDDLSHQEACRLRELRRRSEELGEKENVEWEPADGEDDDNDDDHSSDATLCPHVVRGRGQVARPLVVKEALDEKTVEEGDERQREQEGEEEERPVEELSVVRVRHQANDETRRLLDVGGADVGENLEDVKGRGVGGADDEPRGRQGDEGVALGAKGQRGDGVNDSKIAVE